MDDKLQRKVTLQANEVGEYTQFKITVPSEFARLASWKKGDALTLKMVLGSGQVIIEREEEVN